MKWSEENALRYDRNIRLAELGKRGQERLFASSVLVVGAGGLGSPALLYLAAAGIGRIGVIDGDRLELSNLNRQVIHPSASLGRWKAESAADALRAFRPDLSVDAHSMMLTAENAMALFREYDAVVDACDNFPTKYLCNDAAVVTRRPLVHAGVMRFGGQMLTVLPGETACLRCLIPEIPPREDSPGAAQVGIFGAAAGIVGAWQALEAVRLLAGIVPRPGGKLLTVNALAGEASRHSVPRDPACPVCGESPRIADPLLPAEYLQDPAGGG
ncbi:MAG: HesA/MoeB/ThiF family protein [Deltaproteobacteria bacterium]|nr:HesA/MoeB/ThiF family protein [Deltaproteobacteria bacterium]